MAFKGKVGDGVLGPWEEGAELKEDWEPSWYPVDEPMELTLEDELSERASGGGSARDGNLSLLINSKCWFGSK